MTELYQAAIADDTGTVTGRTVAVGPTATTVVDAFSALGMSRLVVTLTNDDPTQELDAWLEAGPTSSGPWDLTEWTGLADILAGESRTEVADVQGHAYLRIRGTASGAGLSCRAWGSAVRHLTTAVAR